VRKADVRLDKIATSSLSEKEMKGRAQWQSLDATDTFEGRPDGAMMRDVKLTLLGLGDSGGHLLELTDAPFLNRVSAS
jgi:hypothetical protein